MTLSIDLFWSFRSPYSYLATPRLCEMARAFDLDINVRPVYPLAIRFGAFFDRAHPLWTSYLMRDTRRVAEMLGLPYRWPRPDPVLMDPGTQKAAFHQPYIHRLTRLGCAAAEEGSGLAFIREVSRTIWSGKTDEWHLHDHLAQAAARAGTDLARLDRRITAAPDEYEARIAENQDAHEAAGHWGVPTVVFRGEPFFGQDRLDLLLWRLKQCGLKTRGSGQ